MKADLLAIIEEEEEKASQSGFLAQDRQDAIDRYLGEPYGDEVEGRSQVVSRDIYDTIEWIMPSLMKIFTSGDEVVKFTPHGREDLEAAEQETDYLNWLTLQKQENAFLLFYTWFSDALLQRNGYIKDYWDESEDTTEESYEGLTDDALAMILQDQMAEIVAHESAPAPIDPMMAMQMQAAGQEVPMLHSVRVKRKREYGCVKSCNLPPERVLISSRCTSPRPQEADFVEHWEYRTLSELRAQGFDVPDDIAGYDGPEDEDFERDRFGETTFDREEGYGASRKVKVREVWLRFDQDDDGLAELRHVIVVGKTILVNEAADLIPVSCLTPRPWPHRHVGISVYDAIKDIQRIKTALWRTGLDNLYLANHGRWAVSDKVNLDDLMTSRPGGVVRFNDGAIPGQGHITPLVPAQISPATFQMMEYADLVRESRTGVNRYYQGTDANALNKTATGVIQLQQAAQEKVLLIARIFAETGVRDHFQTVHALTLKHARQPEVVRLRGRWIEVDPRQWRERRDMQVSVGLGTGNRDAQLTHLMNIWQMQLGVMPLGLASPANLFQTAMRITQNAGFRDADAFWTDPQTMQQAPQQGPPPPDPKLIVDQQRLQLDAQKAQADMQMEAQRLQIETQQTAALERQRLELDRAKALLDAETKILVAQIQAQAESQRHAMSVQAQAEQQRDDMQRDEGSAMALADALQGFRQAIEQLRSPGVS